MTYIPKDILMALEENPQLSANQIVLKFNRSKSTAYLYIRVFKTINKNDDLCRRNITNFYKKEVQQDIFDVFLFDVLKNGGFKSTRELYEKLHLEVLNSEEMKKIYPELALGVLCSRRTFNKLFANFRFTHAVRLKKLSLRIVRSKHKPDKGFYTQKRKRKTVPEYED